MCHFKNRVYLKKIFNQFVRTSSLKVYFQRVALTDYSLQIEQTDVKFPNTELIGEFCIFHCALKFDLKKGYKVMLFFFQDSKIFRIYLRNT